MLRRFIDNSGLLIAGALLALIWANVDHASYESLAHSLHFVVNDIAMVFFFALATKEVVEATAPGGALHSPRRASVPMIAALGGMAVPAGIFVTAALAAGVPELMRGWAIPCATDIAFSYLVARLVFGPQHPGIPFLLLLAIADDALGLIVLAVFYPVGALRLGEFGLVLAMAMALAWALRRWKVMNFWAYIAIAGVVSWIGFYRGGLHPALALVPIVPFLPHAKRDPGLFVAAPHLTDPLSRFEHWWKLPVQLILFLFGLVNAGVAVTSVGTGTWIILMAIVIGKPVGIVVSTALCVGAGLQKPSGVSWTEMVVLGIIAGIGFTVALFFATAAFSPGRLLDEAKMGALLSFSASLVAIAAAASLRVGRFQRPAAAR